jgi:hypothetical protein
MSKNRGSLDRWQKELSRKLKSQRKRARREERRKARQEKKP